MIRVQDKSKCCGCTACVEACPVQCIVFRRDYEGFDYPFANPDICIGCGKCGAVCPMDRKSELPSEKVFLAGSSALYAPGSSSGGVFPMLASEVIREGGVVFGAAFGDDVRTVGHVCVEDEDSLTPLRKSKYVQSDLYSTFGDVKACLEEGRKVLFSGLPCQVAGLRSFIADDKGLLLTVDNACHGVPAPGLWAKYVDALERKYRKKIVGVDFRDKTKGWRRYALALTFEDGTSVRIPRERDAYLSLFLQDMTLRPSCYSCTFRCGLSGSDITLGDLWNVRNAAPGMDEHAGVSLVVANTAEGRKILVRIGVMTDGCTAEAEFRYVGMEAAMSSNGGFASKVEVPSRREEFFASLASCGSLIPYMRRFVRKKPLTERLYRQLHSFLSGLKKALLRKS